MNADSLQAVNDLISPAYISQASQALAGRQKLIKSLLSQRRLPKRGWDEETVELFLRDAALMDSNNFLDNVGMGEREGRIYSCIVARRHFRLAHGIGRSGEIAAEQPKAAGSSLIARLTNELVFDALKIAGMFDLGMVLTLPLATGMALTTTFLALRGMVPPSAQYIVWPRIDQKTCLKCITAAGFEPLVVEMKLCGEELVTDLEAIESVVQKVGQDAIACVMTTTSCFAPRASDDIVAVAKMCHREGVPHVINNAYGVQSASICSSITSACRKGRVDAIVQSTDKNFMVPVGGAVLASPKNRPELTQRVNSLYPGRAAMSPLLDIFVTLLQLGADGWKEKLEERERLMQYTRDALQRIAHALGERVIATPGNPISMAMTLNTLKIETVETGRRNGSDCDVGPNELQESTPSGVQKNPFGPGKAAGSPTFLGSMLFTRMASGSRVYVPGKMQEVSGIKFGSYGASSDLYKVPYVTVAAAIGGSTEEVDEFLRRLYTCMLEFRKRNQMT